MNSRQVQTYFMERPLALSVIHALAKCKEGLTATELAQILHMSIPTMYRLTLEMHQMRLLLSQRQGRKIRFKLPSSNPEFLSIVSDATQKLNSKNQSNLERLNFTRSIVENYNLPFSPRVAQSTVISILRQKIHENLPVGLRFRYVRGSTTVLNESVHFDLYIGNDENYVAIDLKIVETARTLRERLGTLDMLRIGADGLKGIIIAFIISPIAGQWVVNDNMMSELLEALKDKRSVEPVIVRAERHQILDDKFLADFSLKIVEKVVDKLKHG